MIFLSFILTKSYQRIVRSNVLKTVKIHAQLFIYVLILSMITCYLQNLGSPPFSIYMFFTGSRQSPFLDLHVIYRILTVSPFQFACYLQDLDSPPFSIYKLFTGSCQSPFFFYLNVIYRTLTVPLFRFTCYLQDLASLPFPIYMFTVSVLFDLHVIYVVCGPYTLKFTGSSLLFTCVT